MKKFARFNKMAELRIEFLLAKHIKSQMAVTEHQKKKLEKEYKFLSSKFNKQSIKLKTDISEVDE